MEQEHRWYRGQPAVFQKIIKIRITLWLRQSGPRVIQEVTGHKSSVMVEAYKRQNEFMRKECSDSLVFYNQLDFKVNHVL